MKINFRYEEEKDIWCLLNKGKSSMNSSLPTKEYEQLVSIAGEKPNDEDVSVFIGNYLSDKSITPEYYISKYENEWDAVAESYRVRAEKVFGVSLEKAPTVYLTINSRCPYSIADNYFFVKFPSKSSVKTVMHELWHFYTWYAFGESEMERLGKDRYNEMKEALTVLLNVECLDLLPENSLDEGYPQHRELRQEILNAWEEDRDIGKLWRRLA